MDRISSIFSQIVTLVPRGLFDGAVARHQGEKHAIMCAKSTPARPAKMAAAILASKQHPNPRRPSTRDWPDRAC
jgi:hypothetical protein